MRSRSLWLWLWLRCRFHPRTLALTLMLLGLPLVKQPLSQHCTVTTKPFIARLVVVEYRYIKLRSDSVIADIVKELIDV